MVAIYRKRAVCSRSLAAPVFGRVCGLSIPRRMPAMGPLDKKCGDKLRKRHQCGSVRVGIATRSSRPVVCGRFRCVGDGANWPNSASFAARYAAMVPRRAFAQVVGARCPLIISVMSSWPTAEKKKTPAPVGGLPRRVRVYNLLGGVTSTPRNGTDECGIDAGIV